MRIIHMFNWNLCDIKKELETIYYQGFDAIQINPIQPLKDEESNEWWMSYQPCGFIIGNHYGTKEDLCELCEEAAKYDIKIIADVICNHVAGCDDGFLFPHEKVDKKLVAHGDYFKEFRNINNWNDRYEVTHYCLGLPGLNVYNHNIQDIIIDFLNELIDCGIGGFRFDAAKNIALPEEGCDFWPRVIYCLKKYDLFLYGEIIFESQELIKKYNEYVNVITNSDGYNRDKIVKYIENHDSYLEFGYTKNLTSEQISNQYIELSKNYPHTMYYTRPFDDEWKSERIRIANCGYQKVYKKIS